LSGGIFIYILRIFEVSQITGLIISLRGETQWNESTLILSQNNRDINISKSTTVLKHFEGQSLKLKKESFV